MEVVQSRFRPSTHTSSQISGERLLGIRLPLDDALDGRIDPGITTGVHDDCQSARSNYQEGNDGLTNVDVHHESYRRLRYAVPTPVGEARDC